MCVFLLHPFVGNFPLTCSSCTLCPIVHAMPRHVQSKVIRQLDDLRALHERTRQLSSNPDSAVNIEYLKKCIYRLMVRRPSHSLKAYNGLYPCFPMPIEMSYVVFDMLVPREPIRAVRCCTHYVTYCIVWPPTLLSRQVTRELSEKSRLYPVIGTILKFTPEESRCASQCMEEQVGLCC